MDTPQVPTDMEAAAADLRRIGELLRGFRACRVMTAAVELGVFDAIEAAGQPTTDQVATRIGADCRNTELLLDALVSIGLVNKTEGRYENVSIGRRFLLSAAPQSLVSNLRFQEHLATAWADLPRIVRSGRPAKPLLELLGHDAGFTRSYIRGMADISARPAAELAAALDLGEARDGLDVGGGPAVYARALAQRGANLRMVVLDLPGTLGVAAELLAGSPLKGRIELREGNYHDADFGRDCFDVVLLSHVTHDEGPADNIAMLGKAHAALRLGGQVVVHDFMLDAARTQPEFGALFSVHLMTYTPQGRTYSAEEYQRWLKDCGFRDLRQIDICPSSPNATKAIVGIKS